MLLRLILIVVCMLGLSVPLFAAEPTRIEWQTLAPTAGTQFRDPFSELTQKQLQELSYVVRIQNLISAEKMSSDGESAMEVAAIAERLQEEGVDIPWLMSQRDRVRQLREQQTQAVTKVVAKQLKDKNLMLGGFVIPLKTTEGRITEFYLVSSMAACRHSSAPPSNQVVYVKSPAGIVGWERTTAVQVTGQLRAEETTRTLVRGSQVQQIESDYSMTPQRIVLVPLAKKRPQSSANEADGGN